MDNNSPSTAGGRLRILIDGDHRANLRGSGLSTYSRTLAAALKAIGHEVNWLAGASAPARADPILDEVMTFDRPVPARGLRLQAQTARRMATGLVTSAVTARRIPTRMTVVPEQHNSTKDATWLAPNLFVHAHYRHMLLRQFTQVRTSGSFDVLHLTSPLPIRMKGVKTITTIHDLIPLRLPYTTPDNKAEFAARVRTAARLSNLIITVSECSKKDIVDILDVDPAKVAVTYQPTDISPLTPDEVDSVPRILARFGLKPKNYALFVGALEPKKNLRRMIEAFLDVDTDMPLAIVGRKAWMWENELGWIDATLDERTRKRLRFFGFVERDDLRRLYAGAQFFLFPSLYEGFGLPVLEAMTMGCPVVASSTSSLPEVCGNAALYVAPLERDDIRRQIVRILEDRSLRERLLPMGQTQAAKFSFERYTGCLEEAYCGVRASI